MRMLPAVITMVIVSIWTIWSSLLLANGLHDASPGVIAIGGIVMSVGAAAQLLDRQASQIGGGLLMVSGLLVMVLGFPDAGNWLHWASYLVIFGMLSAGMEASDAAGDDSPETAGTSTPTHTAQIIQLDVFRRR